MTKVKRHCGSCNLCCKLLPVKSHPHEPAQMDKKAGEKCKYQFYGGCRVYNDHQKMPACCRFWNCRWLVNEVPRDIRRPDFCHYVVDVMPDFVTMKDGDRLWNVQVVQIWVDPKYPDAHRDPALRAWLLKLGEQNIIGMVRYNERDSITLLPNKTEDGQWWEVKPLGMQEKSAKTHTLTEIVQALGGDVRMVLEP